MAAAASESVSSRLFQLTDNHLTIPLKHLGLIMLYIGLDITQSHYYVKILCKTYIEHICEKYLDGWMNKQLLLNCPTPLPHPHLPSPSFLPQEFRNNFVTLWVSRTAMVWGNSFMHCLCADMWLSSVHRLQLAPMKFITMHSGTS